MRFLSYVFFIVCFSSVVDAAPTTKNLASKAVVSKSVSSKNAPSKNIVQKKRENKKEEPVKLIGQYKDWIVQELVDKGKRQAYMIGSPKKSTGKYDKRGQVYLLISRQGDLKTGKDIVSFAAGYTYKANAQVDFIFQDNKKFTFFTQGERAWAPDDKTDKAMVEAMKKGSLIKIKGKSTKDTLTEDEISLAGFLAAYKIYLEKNK
ncbi:MAG: invasion associated locus B family protein [Alphaproteobacteria bacterium]|nr:invasion associated locus B family protein [Alphaproteobacteria bacterium]